MKRRTKKQVRERLGKLAKHCFSMCFIYGLASGKDIAKYERLASIARQAFWVEFYTYFGVDD